MSVPQPCEGVQESDLVYPKPIPIKAAFAGTILSTSTKAPLAVDGEPDTCFHAGETEQKPFLLLDLGESKTVLEVHVTNRRDCCAAELLNFLIEVFEADPRSGGSSVICAVVGNAVGLGETGRYQCQTTSATGRVHLYLLFLRYVPVWLHKLESGQFGLGAYANCDFEQPFICGFQNQPNPKDDFDWVRKRGRETNGAGDVTGLNGDHTTGNVLGHYMHLDASPPRSTGNTAKLISPKIRLEQPKNCLSFWYTKSGTNSGNLSVQSLNSKGPTAL
ncbi:hypothetical protein ACOMHN_058103 [Nucella lapillus]